jgi:hypothetical protein
VSGRTLIATTSRSPKPPGQRVLQRDGLILCKRQHARAGDVRVENDLPITLAHHDVGETRWTVVQSTGCVDHRAVVPGPMFGFGWLVRCGHPVDSAVRSALIVHTPWTTLAADAEAIAQAVQLPDSPPCPAVQGEHQVAGDRIVTDSGGRDSIGGVEVPDRFVVPVALCLCPGSCEVEVQRRDAVFAAEGG